jgi:hypothetical protein
VQLGRLFGWGVLASHGLSQHFLGAFCLPRYPLGLEAGG